MIFLILKYINMETKELKKVEEPKKKFIWQLLNPNGDISSKRFGGVSLILGFIGIEVASLFIQITFQVNLKQLKKILYQNLVL